MKLTKKFIIDISKQKKEPKWMTDFRLKSFEKFLELPNPDFGPTINIDFDSLTYYKKVGDASSNWDKIDKNIKATFEELGVIAAEEKYLCGVSNQYESEVIYHNLKDDAKKSGVIFLSTDDALKE